MSLSELSNSIRIALLASVHTINQSSEEQNTGLGILTKQSRTVCRRRMLEGTRSLTSEEIAKQVQAEIAKLVTQLIGTFATRRKLTPEEQGEIVKQVQEEITRQAREEITRQAQEEIVRLVSGEALKETDSNDISWDQLVVALAEVLSIRRSTYDLQVLRINTVIVHLDTVLRQLVNENIILDIKLHPDLWWASFDPEVIRTLIFNLVVNACEVMLKGGHLIIETSNVTSDENHAIHHSEMQTGEYVLLVIRDTGLGMSDEVKKHLFEPFFTTKNDNHKGLGLAAVFSIVKLHGGQIQVHSEIGVGTTFENYLPRVAAPELEPNPLEANIGVQNLVQGILADFGK
jgi:signal transduction histidine kinase